MAKKAKKKKAKKAAKAVKARKTPAKKSAKKSKAKKPAKKKAVKKKVVKALKKPAPKKAAAKKPPKVKKQAIGEGDYEASRMFLKDQTSFVKKNKAKIPEMGKQAEMALEGPEGASLRTAEAEAASHAHTGTEG